MQVSDIAQIVGKGRAKRRRLIGRAMAAGFTEEPSASPTVMAGFGEDFVSA